MELLIILLPLCGALSSGLFGRFIGSYGSVFISINCLISSFIVSLVSLYCNLISGSSSIVEFKWFYLADFTFRFDFNCLIMLTVVSLISSLVHMFSYYYLETDPHIQRFFSYLSLFTVFMMLLLSADNLLLLFAGWEGVGLLSFLLIHFWFTRSAANLSALKAFFINRFGDYGLFVLLLMVFSSFSTSNLSFLSSLMLPDWFFILLFLAAVAKSAQLGLHTWLPSAMEGPTPVSALIHAATMVTAGVYLLIRFDSFYLSFWLGSLTALFGAISGLLEYDIKKVIAYSTTSQLGYMFASLGLSDLSLFHLVNHATFKALLFLTAGSFIHALLDEQDTRKFGGLHFYLPRPTFLLLIGSLSLLAFPFTTGFFSKDLIIQSLFFNKFLFLLTLLAAFFTSLYSIRLVLFGLLIEPSFSRVLSHNVIDTDSPYAWIPFIVLLLLSVLLGYILSGVFYFVVDGIFISSLVKLLLLCPLLLFVLVL